MEFSVLGLCISSVCMQCTDRALEATARFVVLELHGCGERSGLGTWQGGEVRWQAISPSPTGCSMARERHVMSYVQVCTVYTAPGRSQWQFTSHFDGPRSAGALWWAHKNCLLNRRETEWLAILPGGGHDHPAIRPKDD